MVVRLDASLTALGVVRTATLDAAVDTALDTAGVMTSALRTEVHAVKTANQTHTAANYVTLNFQSVATDTLSEWNTTTKKFTATNAGTYLFVIHAEVDDVAGANRNLYMVKNDTTTIEQHIEYTKNADTVNPVMQLTSVVELAADNFVTIRVTCSTVGTTIYGTSDSTLSIIRIS